MLLKSQTYHKYDIPTLSGRVLGNENSIITDANHSHPGGSSVVSPGDIAVAAIIQSRFPNARMAIFLPFNFTSPTYFDRSTPSGVFREVEFIGIKK